MVGCLEWADLVITGLEFVLVAAVGERICRDLWDRFQAQVRY